MSVNGALIQGDVNSVGGTRVHYRFAPDRTPEVPAGALVLVQGVDEARGWIDECCDDGSEGPERISELNLTDAASLPDEAGSYFVE